ncbi:YbfB/YjiJ family MFS transporter [soil metagenome]
MRLGLLLGLLLGLGPAAAVGIGRFAYALVLPEMQWELGLSYAEAGLLGSANTAGYLLGALLSHRALYRLGYRRGFYGALSLQALSLLALALAPPFAGLMLLRFVQGILGAWVFVGGAALLLASGAGGLSVGFYFSGVGLGILLSPLALPLTASWQEAWALLGLLSGLLAALALLAYPRLQEPAPPALGEDGSLRPIAPLLLAYGLYGAGYIGYMTFVTTALPVPLAGFWAVLGVGALMTGVVWGGWVERLGGARALVHVLLVLTLASLFPVMVYLPWLSAFAFGMSFLGVIVAITQVFRRRLPPGAWARAMGLSTAAFALGQALGPSLSGVAGDLVGGAAGALWVSSGLLSLALVVTAGWRQRA